MNTRSVATRDTRGAHNQIFMWLRRSDYRSGKMSHTEVKLCWLIVKLFLLMVGLASYPPHWHSVAAWIYRCEGEIQQTTTLNKASQLSYRLCPQMRFESWVKLNQAQQNMWSVILENKSWNKDKSKTSLEVSLFSSPNTWDTVYFSAERLKNNSICYCFSVYSSQTSEDTWSPITCAESGSWSEEYG